MKSLLLQRYFSYSRLFRENCMTLIDATKDQADPEVIAEMVNELETLQELKLDTAMKLATMGFKESRQLEDFASQFFDSKTHYPTH